eukprot:GHVR01030929.1.p1 GENE.GHVR01030929.1~~GHVR01030929.1.p1  ORF type:complete len:564 (+),score=171.57 GHVR01030929.1:26-1693(+)
MESNEHAEETLEEKRQRLLKLLETVNNLPASKIRNSEHVKDLFKNFIEFIDIELLGQDDPLFQQLHCVMVNEKIINSAQGKRFASQALRLHLLLVDAFFNEMRVKVNQTKYKPADLTLFGEIFYKAWKNGTSAGGTIDIQLALEGYLVQLLEAALHVDTKKGNPQKALELIKYFHMAHTNTDMQTQTLVYRTHNPRLFRNKADQAWMSRWNFVCVLRSCFPLLNPDGTEEETEQEAVARQVRDVINLLCDKAESVRKEAVACLGRFVVRAGVAVNAAVGYHEVQDAILEYSLRDVYSPEVRCSALKAITEIVQYHHFAHPALTLRSEDNEGYLSRVFKLCIDDSSPKVTAELATLITACKNNGIELKCVILNPQSILQRLSVVYNIFLSTSNSNIDTQTHTHTQLTHKRRVEHSEARDAVQSLVRVTVDAIDPYTSFCSICNIENDKCKETLETIMKKSLTHPLVVFALCEDLSVWPIERRILFIKRFISFAVNRTRDGKIYSDDTTDAHTHTYTHTHINVTPTRENIDNNLLAEGTDTHTDTDTHTHTHKFNNK